MWDIEKIEFICYDIKSIKNAYIHVMEGRIITIDKKLEGTKLEIILEGSMIIKNVNDVINDVFEVTGFSDILTIE